MSAWSEGVLERRRSKRSCIQLARTEKRFLEGALSETMRREGRVGIFRVRGGGRCVGEEGVGGGREKI